MATLWLRESVLRVSPNASHGYDPTPPGNCDGYFDTDNPGCENPGGGLLSSRAGRLLRNVG